MQKLSLNVRRFRTLQSLAAIDFPFPVHAEVRFAQLSDAAPRLGQLRPFRPQSAVDLEGFHPNMVAGGTFELMRLAEQKDLGVVNLASVDHAVIALTKCGQAPINDVARVILWQAFGVPVFEIYTGLDNAVLGYECELHEGWHLASRVGFLDLGGELILSAQGAAGLTTNLSGFMTREACPCGRRSARLMDMQAVRRPDYRVQRAAIA